jgi:23S rRNA (guanosine2251-2'-O)-methyltransferase
MAKQNFDWLIGKNALHEAFAAGKILQKVYLGDYLDNQVLKELIKLSRQHKVSVLTVPRTKLDKLCKGNHQGVLAMISPIEFHKVEDLVHMAFEAGKNPCFALLDGGYGCA